MFSEKPYLKNCKETGEDTHVMQTHTIPQTQKVISLDSGMVTQVCNPITWETEAGELPQVWDQPGLYNKLQAGQNYIASPCLNKTKLFFFIYITHSKQK